jgi:uncharacterized protein YkwD
MILPSILALTTAVALTACRREISETETVTRETAAQTTTSAPSATKADGAPSQTQTTATGTTSAATSVSTAVTEEDATYAGIAPPTATIAAVPIAPPVATVTTAAVAPPTATVTTIAIAPPTATVTTIAIAPPTAAVTTTAAPPVFSSYAAEMLGYVNAARAKEGLQPLFLDETLCRGAEIRAAEITGVFSHTRPDGREWDTIFAEVGSTANSGGENIAAGNASAADTFDQWMGSPGHRANILNADFVYMGVGYTPSPSVYGHYWVQLFTK